MVFGIGVGVDTGNSGEKLGIRHRQVTSDGVQRFH